MIKTGEIDMHLASLQCILDGIGGFCNIEEFGLTFDLEEMTTWTYDPKSRTLALDQHRLKEVWCAARRQKESTVILLLSGDSYSAWNARKRQYRICWNEDERTQELAFNAVVLRKHPKAATAWSHRRWCLRDLALDLELLGPELDLCTMLTERYPRNYSAWTHRTWLLHQVTKYHENIHLIKEHTFVQHWLSTHISDHSAVAFAIYVALLLGRKTMHSPQEILHEEQNKNENKYLNDLRILQEKLSQDYPHLAISNVGALAYLKRATSSSAKTTSTCNNYFF
mmetsp:Transcript_2853/g.3955  ORF Transcript_2853/g.3955 Transcript_2853/m.3955 type:complete len:282 (-) Transcript_2853:1679-2524(-)